MEIFIFFIYLVAVLLLINFIPFFKKSGLGHWLLSGLFVIKVLAGIAYAQFYKLPKYYEGADTWRFYRLSLEESKWLLKSPATFFRDLFVHGYGSSGNLFSGTNSYWNDLKSNIPVKLMACTNVITNNNYYANLILFNFLFFVGLVALYVVFKDVFPKKKLFIVLGVFLMPSTLFWCSGIHKDGLILSALGIITGCFYWGLKKGFNVGRIAAIVICIVVIFSLRNYVALALIPGMMCWYLSKKLSYSKALVFTAVYAIGIILFFSAKVVSPKLDFPSYIVQKQTEFGKLEGNSTVKLDFLSPTFVGFARFFPNVLDMAFLQPHVTELKNPAYIPAALENILLIVIFILALFKARKIKTSSTILFCLFLSVSLLLLAGYTITLSGAIVRYRSVTLPLLITPLLCSISFKKSRTRT